jgi:hypothetical protein
MKALTPLAELHGVVTSSALQKILGALIGR